MPAEQTVAKRFHVLDCTFGDTSEAFHLLFRYIRKNYNQFDRIHCQNIHIDKKGKDWDYAITKNNLIITKSRLCFDLKHDINATLDGMPTANVWLDGATTKKSLLKILSDFDDKYYEVNFSNGHFLSSVSSTTEADLDDVTDSILSAVERRKEMIAVLDDMRVTISREKKRLYVRHCMIDLKKLSRGQTIMGEYFKYTLSQMQRRQIKLPKIITHAKAITFLKRKMPGKRQNLERRNQIIQHINIIKNSKARYFEKTNDDNLVHHLTGRTLIQFITIIKNYLICK